MAHAPGPSASAGTALRDPAGDGPAILRERVVRFGDVDYRYVVADGGWSLLTEALRELDVDRVVMVVDLGVPAALRERAVAAVRAAVPAVVLPVAVDETAKRLATVERLAEAAIAGGATRRSCVLGLGGGMLGNLAGVLAALLFRGLRLLHLPSTLLAASDSTLSLKQAVNAAGSKNLLGCYHPPTLVWTDLQLLRALPDVQLRSGLCEAAKNMLAITPDLLPAFERLAAAGDWRRSRSLAEVIDWCVTAKTSVMAADARERRAGLVLEYGHTVGHALELSWPGSLPHGFAVGLGMRVAAEVAVELGFLDRAPADRHDAVLARIGAPRTVPADVSEDEVLGRVAIDNKRGYLDVRAGELPMVLLSDLGQPVCTDGLPLHSVPAAVVARGLAAVRGPGAG